MSFISGESRINSTTNYHLFSDFVALKPWAGDKTCGDVYLISTNQLPQNSVIDYDKIPFKSGAIKYLAPAGSYCGSGRLGEMVVGEKLYQVHAITPFSKGTYCGRQYEIAAKIDYINRHKLQGDMQICPNVAITHDGEAITVSNSGWKYCRVLDIKAIEQAYQDTQARVEPRSIQGGVQLTNSQLNLALLTIICTFVFFTLSIFQTKDKSLS